MNILNWKLQWGTLFYSFQQWTNSYFGYVRKLPFQDGLKSFSSVPSLIHMEETSRYHKAQTLVSYQIIGKGREVGNEGRGGNWVRDQHMTCTWNIEKIPNIQPEKMSELEQRNEAGYVKRNIKRIQTELVYSKDKIKMFTSTVHANSWLSYNYIWQKFSNNQYG